VSINTVAFHMRHIYEKLQVHSKSEAVAKALRDRIVN
jgi:DNA-binding CsgD family transcriptional regulator